MNKGILLVSLCTASLAAMLISIPYAQSHQAQHKDDNVQRELVFCFDSGDASVHSPKLHTNNLTKNCLWGVGTTKQSVREDIIKKLTRRIMLNPDSKAYKLLTSQGGLHFSMQEKGLEMAGKVELVVRQDGKGKLSVLELGNGM
jgi:hypothetical protein